MSIPFRAASLAAVAYALAGAMLFADLPALGAQTMPDYHARADALITALAAGRYEQAAQDFSDAMRAALPPAKLAEAWRSVQAQAGAFQHAGTHADAQQGPYHTVIVEGVFANATLDVKVTFDASEHVAGLFFSPQAAPASSFAPPPYADSSRFHERDVSVGSGALALPATLSMPVGPGPFPAVVLVHGSGPNDRDETVDANKPFRDLAWGLASRGVAVLRYEKRTRAHPQWFLARMSTFTVNDETVDDAIAAVALLRSTEGISANHVYVLGHSLGGTMIPRIGERDRAIAGFIIMAGATRPLEDLLVDQTSYLAGLSGDTSAAMKAHLDSVRAQAARVKSPTLSPSTPASELPLRMSAAYWLNLRGYDPAAEARKLDRPILVLQGERDYQVTLADFTGWRHALDRQRDVTFHLYPGLDHLFLMGTGKSTPAEYRQPGHVAEVVVRDIATWITAQAR